jgi:DNA-binding NarL/FixJ family response regulator
VYARALLEESSAGRAYLLRERASHPEQLVGAIREVARGGSIIDPKVVETLVAALGELVPEREPTPTVEARRPARPGAEPIEPLTERERVVLQCVAAGQTNKEIGNALGYAEVTVKKYVQTILAKLYAKDCGRAKARIPPISRAACAEED